MASSPPALSTADDTRDCAIPADAPAPPPPACEPRRARGALSRWVADLFRRAFETSHYDPRFSRPDIVEDDYFRFRNQPRD